MEVMEDPVNTVDGQTYERYAIQDWFNQGKTTSPMTNEELVSTRLVSNRALKQRIVAWRERNAVRRKSEDYD